MRFRLFLFAVLALALCSASAWADTTVCYPVPGNFNTGSTDGSTKTRASAIAGYNTEDGWAKFDTAVIPDTDNIVSIEFHFYVSSTYWPYWSVTPVSGEPVAAGAASLYADINTEAEGGFYNYQNEDSAYTAGWHTLVLGGTANTDLQALLAGDWFALGVASRDDSPSYWITLDGWAEANPPYLVVQHQAAPPPDCSSYLTDLGTVSCPGDVPASGSTTGDTNYCGHASGDDHYQFTVPAAGNYTISLCYAATTFDTFLRLYSLDCCGTLLAYNDDYCGLQSRIDAALDPGTYYVQVEGYGTAEGPYELHVICSDLAGDTKLRILPENDCYEADDTVHVAIRLDDAGTTITGGQFFLTYDITKLDFVSLAAGDAPFTRAIYQSVNEGAGTIDYAVGVPDGGSGTVADTAMAHLVFTALAELCVGDDVIDFRPNTPPTVLSDAHGDDVDPSLFALDFNDTEAPAITVFPGDQNLQCFADLPVPSIALVEATDNCDPLPVITHIGDADNSAAGCTASPRIITRTYRATDHCGNFTDQDQVFTIADTTVPVITQFPADQGLQCQSEVPDPNIGLVEATDNCDSTPTITHVSDTNNGGAGCQSDPLVITRRYRVVDDCGNTTEDVQLFTIVDNTAPVIGTFPGDQGLQCSSELPAANIALVAATDNCGGVVNITHVGDANNGGAGCASNPLVITRTYRATDGCGNQTDRNQVFTIIDTTAPVIGTFPADQELQCQSAVPAANIVLVAATDNCGGVVNITHVGDANNGGAGCVSDPLVITRTYRAADACGNAVTRNQLFTIIDTTAPVIGTFPGDQNLQCTADLPLANTGLVAATDNCSVSVTITHVGDTNNGGAGCVSNPLVVTRTYRAADACGNAVTQNQTFTIADTINPAITQLPTGQSLQCLGNVPSPDTGLVTATDNCDATPTITFVGDTDNDGAGCVGDPLIITRTYRATDDCGNFVEGSQVFTIVDDTVPVIGTFPGSQNLQCLTDLPAANIGLVAATDNCGGAVTITHQGDTDNDGSGCASDPLIVTRTYRATDTCGNFAEQTQTFTIADTINPVLAGVPLEATVQCDAVPAAASVTATDNCDDEPLVELDEDITAGSCPGQYTITRTWTATDNCGNSSNQVQLIHVIDTTDPVLVGVPLEVTVQCDAVPNPASVTAADNCDDEPLVELDEDITAGSCADQYTITRTWTATDNCGNSSNQVQLIHVIDTTAPVLAGVPLEVTVQCDAVPAAASVTATDNCDSSPTVELDEQTAQGGCADQYTITRTWTATDDCGNTFSQFQTIHVQDTTDPVLVGVPLEATVQCDAVPAAASVTAADNCDDEPLVELDEEITAGSCADQYTITRTWTATDNCGNIFSQFQTIHVQDTTDPVLVGVPLEATVQCNAVPAAASVTATDNCDDEPLVELDEDITAGSCADQYTITRTWTATDNCGNASNQVQLIHVIDTTAPVLAGVPLEATVQCDAVPAAASVTATDNCDDEPLVELDEDITAGSCADQYTITRTWTATDNCGNASNQVQLIHVIDTTAPVLAGVPLEATVQCDAVPAAASVTAIDNCDDEPLVELDEDITAGSCPGQYTITRTWTATDDCGNASNQVQLIHVIDTTAPVLAGVPLEVTVQCDAVPDPASVTATDNCDDDPLVELDEDITAGSCPGQYTITRTWTATDNCGNASNQVQLIHVIDTTAPIITGCPEDVTVSAAAGGCTAVVAWDAPSATDNCDPSVPVVCSPASGSVFHAGTTTVTVAATDDCGNLRTCTFDVTVVGENELVLDLALGGTMQSGEVTRCITFELWNCAASPTTPAATLKEEITFEDGVAQDIDLLVPCGAYSCITARDDLHTLRRTLGSLPIVGNQYIADFVTAGENLVGGNLNDDIWVDILDFGVFSWQWAQNYGSGDTTCTTSYPHADINGDGLVDTADFTFIQINFLQGDEANCCGAPGSMGIQPPPVRSISVEELRQRGMAELAAGDLNQDRLLDQADVAAFIAGVRPGIKPQVKPMGGGSQHE